MTVVEGIWDPGLQRYRYPTRDAVIDRLVDRANVEPRETDPGLAAIQDARDYAAASGDFDLADSHDRLLDALRGPSEPVSRTNTPIPEPRARDTARER